MSTDHYENFPVASFLCPPALRPAVLAIYHFARTADDIADEGDATPAARVAELTAYRADLDAVYADRQPSARWQAVFERLAAARKTHALPHAPLANLLAAFEQDTGNPVYHDRVHLLAYCERSANPIGRLLLHLYGVADAPSLRQSDAVCSALQLINFWQDCSVDLPRCRLYLPLADAARHGVDVTDARALGALGDTAATRALLADLCAWAQALMHEGAPLVHRIPGRAGWELRLVVQGGLRVLAKIRTMGYSTVRQRPVLTASDAVPVLWRALTMRPARRGSP